MTINRRRFLFNSSLFTISILLLDSFWFERFFIEVKNFALGKRNQNNQIKVIQISDLHLKSLSYQLRKLAQKINHINPDLILFTGDVVDNKEKLEILDQFLGKLDDKIQKVAILGNWEYWGNVDLNTLRVLYANHSCNLLINQNTTYTFRQRSITIIGLDDYIGGTADISIAIQKIPTSDVYVVLNHCPIYSELIAKYLKGRLKPNLILSGHTHGGQINIFGLVPFLPQGSGRFVKGWYDLGGFAMYVSKGIGTSMLPIRLGSRAEIAVFEL